MSSYYLIEMLPPSLVTAALARALAETSWGGCEGQHARRGHHHACTAPPITCQSRTVTARRMNSLFKEDPRLPTSSEQWHYVHVPKNSVGYLLELESYYYWYMYMYMLALSPKDETTFHGIFLFRQFYFPCF